MKLRGTDIVSVFRRVVVFKGGSEVVYRFQSVSYDCGWESTIVETFSCMT